MDGKLPADDQENWARNPFYAHFDVGIEPCDIYDLRKLKQHPYSWDHKGIKGMLQFYLFNTYAGGAANCAAYQEASSNEPVTPAESLAFAQPSEPGPFIPFPPTFEAALSDARAYADSQEGGSNRPIVLTTFSNTERQMLGMAVIISPRAIEIVRNKEAYLIHMPQVGCPYEDPTFLTLPSLVRHAHNSPSPRR